MRTRLSLLIVGGAWLCVSLAAQQAPPPQPAQGRGGAAPAGQPGTPARGQGGQRGAQAAVNASPPHVYIRVGLKSHGAGQHDYPQFVADWSKILTDHGAIVDAAFHFPSAKELANTDVLVMYKGDAGYMGLEDRAVLDTYLRNGGGLVSFHDTLCGDDPVWMASILGGAKKHGEVNYSAGPIKYTIVDKASPIMTGLSDFTIDDEAFYSMTWATSPKINVLATAVMPPSGSAGTHVGEVVPQIWTYERSLALGTTYRAFVWMQGHNYVNFTNPQIEPMILRGIAWAAKRPIDSLVNAQPARGGGGGRGGN